MSTETATAKAHKPRKQDRQTEAAEVQNLANLPVHVKAFGREYEIRKFNIGQIAQAVTYVGTLQHVIQQIVDVWEQEGALSKGQFASVAVGAISQSPFAAIGLLSVATSEPVEWIQEQDDPIGALEILTASIEKNADFFSQENIERVKGLFGRLQQAIPALSGITSTP